MNKTDTTATVLAFLSGIQGYTGLLPVDSVTSSGIGAVIACVIFSLNIVIKRRRNV